VLGPDPWKPAGHASQGPSELNPRSPTCFQYPITMTASGQASDSIEALFDFAEYENSTTYQSPSLSPSGSGKNAFVRPISQAPTPIMPAATQPLSGPSHQYELYKQQTGIVPGALASTLAINQNSQVANYNGMGLEYLG